MTGRERLAAGTARLTAAGIDDAGNDARLLALAASGLSLAGFLLHQEEPWEGESAEAFGALIARRGTREPLQYSLGQTEFMGLPFSVGPGVLIPRQDTETLAERVLADQRKYWPEGASLFDLCTGSGALALSLAKLGRFAPVTASDLSEEALAYARKNAEKLKLSCVEFRQGDLFDPLKKGEKYDIIVSNPPYIREGDREELAPEVRAFEPEEALFAGSDGLAFYRRIAAEAPAYLKPGGRLYLEIGYDQSEAVRALLAEAGFCGIEILNDLAGRTRAAAARRPGETHV